MTTLKKFDKLSRSVTNSKKGRSAKQKGKTGEYKVAAILSEISGMNFQRIFTSGAAIGSANRNRMEKLTLGQIENGLGDISAPEILKYFLINEVKNYKELAFHQLLNPSGCKQVTDWLEEIMYDVVSAKTFIKKPSMGFLNINITNKGTWVVVNHGMLYHFHQEICLSRPALLFNYTVKDKILLDDGWDNSFIMCDLTTFYKENKWIFTEMSDEEILQNIKNSKKIIKTS